MIVDVELYYYRGDEPGGEDTWCAEWCRRGEGVAIEEQESDLAVLVDNIVGDVGGIDPDSLNWQFDYQAATCRRRRPSKWWRIPA